MCYNSAFILLINMKMSNGDKAVKLKRGGLDTPENGFLLHGITTGLQTLTKELLLHQQQQFARVAVQVEKKTFSWPLGILPSGRLLHASAGKVG